MASWELENLEIASTARLLSETSFDASHDHPVWFCGSPRFQTSFQNLSTASTSTHFFRELRIQTCQLLESIFWCQTCQFGDQEAFRSLFPTPLCVDHMQIPKTLKSGGNGPLFLPNSVYGWDSFWGNFCEIFPNQKTDDCAKNIFLNTYSTINSVDRRTWQVLVNFGLWPVSLD